MTFTGAAGSKSATVATLVLATAADSGAEGEGTFSLDGEATTAMLGADYARGNWLLGMALLQSSGEGGYRGTDPGENICADPDMDGVDPPPDLCNGAVRNGEVEATLTAAVSYAALQASERLKLYGALGHGTGEVTLKPDLGGRALTSDVSWTMAALGLRGDVVAPQDSGPALAVTSDALWARTGSDNLEDRDFAALLAFDPDPATKRGPSLTLNQD